MLPFTPISEELLPSSWIQEEYPILEQVIFYIGPKNLLEPFRHTVDQTPHSQRAGRVI